MRSRFSMFAMYNVALHNVWWRRSVIWQRKASKRNINFSSLYFSTLRALLLHLTDEWARSMKYLRRTRDWQNKSCSKLLHHHTSSFSRVKSFWSRCFSCLYKLTTRKKLAMRTAGKGRERERTTKSDLRAMLRVHSAVHHNLKLPKACTAAHRMSSAGCRRWRFRKAAVFAGLSSKPPQVSSRSAEIYWAGMRSKCDKRSPQMFANIFTWNVPWINSTAAKMLIEKHER